MRLGEMMMRFRATRRNVAIAGIALPALALTWAGTHQSLNDDWVSVRRDRLVIGVEVTGALRAVDTSQLGPPAISEVWEFKVSFLAPEGKQVKKGEAVLAFDTTSLEQSLAEAMAARDAATEKVEQKKAAAALKKHEDALRVAEAEAKHGKSVLKTDTPPELAGHRELEIAKLDLALASGELDYALTTAEKAGAEDAAQIEALVGEMEEAARDVADLERAIGQMRISAPRDGIVIYVTDRRGEKSKVGDTAWLNDKLVEIPDLRKMKADGEVDEADAGRVAVGQPVSFRLDAHPDVELRGRISSISRIVQRRSRTDPTRVVKLEIELDRTDPERMRPGMRFRGEAEVEVQTDALVVPSESIYSTASSPVVYRRSWLRWEKIPVSIGRRNEELVEVLAGLAEGDLISRHDLDAESTGVE